MYNFKCNKCEMITQGKHLHHTEHLGRCGGTWIYDSDVKIEEKKAALSAMGSASPTVTGFISFSVFVDCPHCKNSLDLNLHPYDQGDEATELGMGIFGSADTPARWKDLKIEYECTHCHQKFNLNKLEY